MGAKGSKLSGSSGLPSDKTWGEDQTETTDANKLLALKQSMAVVAASMPVHFLVRGSGAWRMFNLVGLCLAMSVIVFQLTTMRVRLPKWVQVFNLMTALVALISVVIAAHLYRPFFSYA